MLVRDGPQVEIVSRTNNVQVGLRVSASDLEQAAGRALTGAPRTAVDPSSPPARVTVSVTTSLLASIVEQLRKVEQLNNSRAWSLEQDVALLEQLSKSVPVSKIVVQGKTSERAAPHRISELDKQLPGIIADVRRISCANELCEAEKAYMDRSLSGAVTQALSGIATVARLAAKQHTDHFLWLFSADIVIIDEISMLTATALSGVDAALSFVATNAEATSGAISSFGGKTLIAVGDLYQLPAVEEYRKSGDQVADGDLWPEFTFLELDESCRVDPAEVELGALCTIHCNPQSYWADSEMYSRVKLQLFIIYTVVRILNKSNQTFSVCLAWQQETAASANRREPARGNDARHDQTRGRASATLGDRGTGKVPDRPPSQEGV